MGPQMGFLLDNWPDGTGHYLLFRVVAGFALAGLCASMLSGRLTQTIGVARH
jgi:hypothetical protein